MITADNHVGRLIEVRYESAGTLQDHQALNAKVYALLARMSGKGVFCTDMRGFDLLDEELATRLSKAYRVANAKVERTALLARPGTKLAEQLTQIARDAGSLARRVFVDIDEARRWLGEVLDDAERAQLELFVARR